MEGSKARAARAARNRRKRNYTPDSSDFSDEEEGQSDDGNTQLIPTPSLDSVLLNMASQALASADQVSSARPSPHQQNSPRPRFPPRSLVKDDSPEVIQHRSPLVEEPRQNVASALLGVNRNRAAAPSILNRQPRRLPPPSSVSSSSEGVAAPDLPLRRPLRVHPPSAAQPAHKTLAANLAEVLNSSHNESPPSRPFLPVVRPTQPVIHMPKRNRFSETDLRDDQFASEDASVPFCNKCAREFPNLLRSLDRLDSRINNLMSVMKAVIEKGRNNPAPAPLLRVPVGYNGTPTAIKVIPRKTAPVAPKEPPAQPQQLSSSESDSEPEPSVKEAYLSALEKEILQVTPDKFNLIVLNELSETVKETRPTKVTTALDHLLKLRIIKTLSDSRGSSTNNNSTVLYKKNMKKFAELKL